MAWEKLYNLTPWKNLPNKSTPLGQSRLNPQHNALDGLDNRVLNLKETKLDVEVANGMVKNVTFDESSGVFTVTYLNGTTALLDTKLEKLAVNFRFDVEAQQLIIVLDDGTEQIVDLSALITQYEFVDTDTIDFSIDASGKASAIVKEGSIQEKHLQPNYLADIKVESAKAQASAEAAAASEANAATSATNAASSEANAQASEIAAAESEANARTSENAAKVSEMNAALSEQNAKASEEAAASSETNAQASADATKVSETNAASSEANAKISEMEAATSETNAQVSANAAKISETNAASSEANAKASEIAAKTSELSVSGSAETASSKAAQAISSAAEAATSATSAALSAETASSKAADASAAATSAADKASDASDYAELSKSYAVGTGNIARQNDDADNSKYYAEQAAKSAALAEQTVNINLPSVYVDLDTMELMGKISTGYVLYLDENGMLWGGVANA